MRYLSRFAVLLSLLVCSFRLSAQNEFVGPFASWRNAKTQCGASGNGSTDDTSALQSCLNGLNGSYDVVYLPAGTYKISSTLTVNYKQYWAFVGADPSTVTIKWAGSSGGIMFDVNGGWGIHWGRITWDGSGTAGIGVAHRWTRAGGLATSNMQHTDEVFENMGKGIEAGINPPGANDAEIQVLRCTFTGMTVAGVSTETQNAVDIWVWDSTFTNNARGVANDQGSSLGGNFSVYRCLFENSTVADMEMAATTGHASARYNTSNHSRQFFLANVQSQNGEPTLIQGNTVLDTTNPNAIEIANLGTVFVIDNKIRSAPGNTGAAVTQNDSGYTQGSDIVSIGNQFTVSPSYQNVTGVSPARYWSQEDQTVAYSSISSTLPTMPGTPPNNNRTIFDVAGGASASMIQAAINNATAVHNKAVVHLPVGSYSIASTLSIPSGSDIQIIGDGYYSTLHWSGASGGKIFQIGNQSKATISDVELNGNNHAADGIEVDSEDAPGSRVFMENSREDTTNGSVFADTLVNTIVEVIASNLSHDGGSDLKSTSNGNVNSSYLAIWGGDPTYTGSGSDPLYEVANGGQIVASEVWWEGSPVLINATATKGNFTLASGHLNTATTGSSGAAVNVAGFNGNFTILAQDTNFFHNTAEHFTIASEVSGTNVLIAGVKCCYFNQAVKSAAPQYLFRNSSGGHVTFINNKAHGTDGDWQIADTQDARDASHIDSSLALLRNIRPTADPIPATASGSTDVQIYRTHFVHSHIGLHVISVGGGTSTLSPPAAPGGLTVTVN